MPVPFYASLHLIRIETISVCRQCSVAVSPRRCGTVMWHHMSPQGLFVWWMVVFTFLPFCWVTFCNNHRHVLTFLEQPFAPEISETSDNKLLVSHASPVCSVEPPSQCELAGNVSCYTDMVCSWNRWCKTAKAGSSTGKLSASPQLSCDNVVWIISLPPSPEMENSPLQRTSSNLVLVSSYTDIEYWFSCRWVFEITVGDTREFHLNPSDAN